MFKKAWDWVKGLWAKRSSSEDRFGLYHPREREIYEYFDGDKLVKADPMVIYKRIMARGQEISVDITVARSPMKGADKAHDSLIKKIREVFNVKPLSEGGLTEQETMDLFDDFLVYVDAIKKNTTPPPDLPEETSPSTSSPTAPFGGESSAPAPDTKSSSDSGSTSSETSSAPPPQSPTGPPSPSGPSVPV